VLKGSPADVAATQHGSGQARRFLWKGELNEHLGRRETVACPSLT
ncbi:hypothetical protein LCGC14_2072330, partial [marine sediment metagenome]